MNRAKKRLQERLPYSAVAPTLSSAAEQPPNTEPSHDASTSPMSPPPKRYCAQPSSSLPTPYPDISLESLLGNDFVARMPYNLSNEQSQPLSSLTEGTSLPFDPPSLDDVHDIPVEPPVTDKLPVSVTPLCISHITYLYSRI
jgi:hypothetical protein